MYKSLVYKGEELLGEVEIYPEENENKNKNKNLVDELKEIRISHFSQSSERCPPVAVLHTISSHGVCFKMESKTSQSQDTPLFLLHSSCVMENKVDVLRKNSRILQDKFSVLLSVGMQFRAFMKWKQAIALLFC